MLTEIGGGGGDFAAGDETGSGAGGEGEDRGGGDLRFPACIGRRSFILQSDTAMCTALCTSSKSSVVNIKDSRSGLGGDGLDGKDCGTGRVGGVGEDGGLDGDGGGEPAGGWSDPGGEPGPLGGPGIPGVK